MKSFKRKAGHAAIAALLGIGDVIHKTAIAHGVGDAYADLLAGAQVLTLPSTGFIRERTVLEFIPISRGTLWNMVKAGKFPAPVKLATNITAWRVEDIQALIERLGSQPAVASRRGHLAQPKAATMPSAQPHSAKRQRSPPAKSPASGTGKGAEKA